MALFDGLFGSLISAGANLLGGSMQTSNAANVAAQNIALQTQFAKQGLQWRAADATAAQNQTGINRLTLLGAPSASFSNIAGNTDAGQGVQRAGQDLGRAANALLAKQSRAEILNEQLLQAKIDNVNADTIEKTAAASRLARTFQPGSGPGVPMPQEDPRGPVIPLMQRAQDPRTGEIVWIPSEKAASPLQTLAVTPLNMALAGKGLAENLAAGPGSSAPDWMTSMRPDLFRSIDPQSLEAMY